MVESNENIGVIMAKMIKVEKCRGKPGEFYYCPYLAEMEDFCNKFGRKLHPKNKYGEIKIPKWCELPGYPEEGKDE